MTISKNGSPISSLEDWKRLAPPKAEHQWTDGRSAKEVARTWLAAGAGKLPAEVTSALGGHPDFADVLTWSAEPEAKLKFDTFAGEPRNTDLAVYARDSLGDFLVAIEAKADEPFAETVSETLAAALERKLENPRSNGIARVEQLATALLGPRQAREPSTGELRYQLLTACAGALCEAERRGLSRAVVMVQEFVTAKTTDEKHLRNAADLIQFLRRLSHDPQAPLPTSTLAGPFAVPGAPLLRSRVRLYVGKVTHYLRTSGA